MGHLALLDSEEKLLKSYQKQGLGFSNILQ